MKIRKALIYFMAVLGLASCAKTVPTLNTNITAAEAVVFAKSNTPPLCAYKGRAAVKAESGGEKVSFSTLLDKTCQGDVKIAVLGALNSVAARIDTLDGDIFITAQDENIKKYLESEAPFYVALIKSYLKSPVILPEKNAKLSFEGSDYIFTDDKGSIYAGDNFKIYKYTNGTSSVTYKWNGDFINDVSIKSKTVDIFITFLNKSGWKGPKAGF